MLILLIFTILRTFFDTYLIFINLFAFLILNIPKIPNFVLDFPLQVFFFLSFPLFNCLDLFFKLNILGCSLTSTNLTKAILFWIKSQKGCLFFYLKLFLLLREHFSKFANQTCRRLVCILIVESLLISERFCKKIGKFRLLLFIYFFSCFKVFVNLSFLLILPFIIVIFISIFSLVHLCVFLCFLELIYQLRLLRNSLFCLIIGKLSFYFAHLF